MWRFVAEHMAGLDGWAVADNLADAGGSRCLMADPLRLDLVETWVDSAHLWTRRAALVFTLAWMQRGLSIPGAVLGWSARLAARLANGSSRRR